MCSCKYIVDRDIETDNLIEDIKTNDNLTINILYAPTAVGKSSITTKLSYKLFKYNLDCIVVRTNPINKTHLSEWTFVNYLFDEFKNFYQNMDCSFHSYINSNRYFLNLKAKNEIDVLKDTNKDNILFKPFLLKQMNSVYDVSDILLENENIFLYAKQEYINYILSSRTVVLIIDNLQIIDDYSLSFLKRCFQFNNSHNHYIIFEYTENKDVLEVIKLSEYFESEKIVVKITPVDKTDSRYIADIIDHKISSKPKDFQFNYDLITHYVESNTGNIRELIDFSLNYNKTEKINVDKTLEVVLQLSEIELYVLYILLIFDGCVDYKYLVNISDYAKINNFKKALKNLFIKHLVKNVDENKIAIEHASITDALKANNSKLIIAKDTTVCIIKSYVENLFINNDDIYPFLRVILNIYKNQSPVDILKLLDYIESSILINLQPKEAWDYFSAFIDVTIDNIKDYYQLYVRIFRMCFKFELYEEGFSCLENIYESVNICNTPEIIIYRMLYMAALDRHKENILYFYSVKSILLSNERLYLNANLAVLSSYRSLGDYKSCLKIHKELKKRKYRKYIEYGYRNRLVDMYLNRQKCIGYLNKSIKHFEKNKQYMQVAKTLVTYTHVLGGLGQIKAAKEKINKAEILLSGEIIGKHMILVNQAVLDLIDNNFSIDTYRLLDMAETSAIVPFDKLAIIVNKLVWCYENDRFDLVHELSKSAEMLLVLEPDKHIHSLLYYNLYANYNKEGEYCIANQYLDKAIETMDYCEPVKARILNKPTKDTKFILSKPWHICYLTYWTFDVLL